MSADFNTAVEFVFKHEGGLSYHPDDPGGLTNFGISQRAYPNLNIRALTIDQAREIYRRDYWERCRCADLPSALGFLLFDSAIQHGASTAILTLQRALKVKSDGIIGPVTLSAAASTLLLESIPEFVARRSLLYARRYAVDTMIDTFGLGWFRRLAAAHQAALKLIAP